MIIAPGIACPYPLFPDLARLPFPVCRWYSRVWVLGSGTRALEFPPLDPHDLIPWFSVVFAGSRLAVVVVVVGDGRVRELDDALAEGADADHNAFRDGGGAWSAVEEGYGDFWCFWWWRSVAIGGGGPEFLVELGEAGFRVGHLACLEAGAVVEEVGRSLVGGGEVAARVEEAGPCGVDAAGEAYRRKIACWRVACGDDGRGVGRWEGGSRSAGKRPVMW